MLAPARLTLARLIPARLALAHLLTLICLSAPLVLAQSERRPEAFQLAIGMQQRGLHEEAARYLTTFVTEQPKHALIAEAYYRLAQSRVELGQDEQAITSCREALKQGGAKFALRAEAQYRLGNLLQGKGEHQQALQCFEQLGKEIQRDHYLAAAASYAKGEVLRDLSKDQACAEAFAATAELATGEQVGFLFPALYQGGFAWLRLQQFAKAAKAFTAAERAAPDAAAKGECLYLVGDAQMRSREFAKAEASFRAALKLPCDFQDDAQFALGWCALAREDREAALKAFAALLKNYQDSPFADAARLERGRCLYQAQQFDAALRELQPLLQDGHELQQVARELQGLCSLASGAGQAAVTNLQQALANASDEDRPRLQFALGEALANLNRWPEALQAYQLVLAADQTRTTTELRGDAYYGACHAHHELKQHEQSIAAATRVLAIKPAHRSSQLAQLAIAENHFALRQFPQAEPSYQALADSQAHGALAKWKLAWCRYLQGDKAGAAKRFALIAEDAKHANCEEAMAMQALSLFECGERDPALAVADRYRARFQDGAFLPRTERIAARVLRQRGDLGAAQRRLQRAASIAASRDGAEAAHSDLAEQADLAYQQGDYQAADELFAQLRDKQDAIGARALAGRAWCAFELGDDQACAQALAVAKQHPAVAEELAGLLELESALYHRMKSWPQAITAARQFLQQFQKSDKAPMLRYALGVALARQGEHLEARKVLAQLANEGGYQEPDRVLYELAWAARRDGDEAAALANFRKVAASSKDQELAGEARLFVGTTLLAAEPRDLPQAAQFLAKVSGSHQKQALYRLGFAEVEAADQAQQPEQKQQWLQQALQRFRAIAGLPGEELLGEALFLAAESCRRLGDAAGAVALAQRLLRDTPKDERAAQARLVIGECSLQLAKPDDAIAPLEQYLRDHVQGKDGNQGDAIARADAARANLWLGKARLLRRQYPAAEKCFVAVTELSNGPLAAEAQFRLGESRAERKDYNGAVDAFVKLSILYADATWVRRGLLQAGRTYEQLKQPEKAKTLYAELRSKFKDSEEAKSIETPNQNR